MSTRKKLISNAFYLFLDWLVVTFMGFLYWLIAGKMLIPEEYGVVSTATNLSIILSGISLLGLNTALWKLIPEYQVKNRMKIKPLIRFALKITLVSNLLLAFFLLVLSSFLQNVLKIPLIAIWLAVLTIIFCSFSTQFGTIIYGFQNMRKFLETDWWGQLAKITVSAILIFLGFGYLGPLIGFSLGVFVLFLLRFFQVDFRGNKESINGKKIILHYALPAFVANLAWIIFLNGQYVLLTALKSPRETGIFTIAMIITSPIFVIGNTLTSALLPLASKLSANHDSKNKTSHLIKLVCRYTLFLSFPCALFLIIFSKPVILIFSRPEYLNASSLFPILAIGSLIYGLGNIFLSNLYAIGKTKLNRNIVLATTLFFFVLAIPLIQKFSYYGLAVAYTLSVTFLTILSFFYLRKFLKITLSLIDAMKIIFSSLVSFSFLRLVTNFTSGLLIGILLAIVAGIFYLALLVPLRFYKKEDVKNLRFILSKSPFLKKKLLSLIQKIIK